MPGKCRAGPPCLSSKQSGRLRRSVTLLRKRSAKGAAGRLKASIETAQRSKFTSMRGPAQSSSRAIGVPRPTNSPFDLMVQRRRRSCLPRRVDQVLPTSLVCWLAAGRLGLFSAKRKSDFTLPHFVRAMMPSASAVCSYPILKVADLRGHNA